MDYVMSSFGIESNGQPLTKLYSMPFGGRGARLGGNGSMSFQVKTALGQKNGSVVTNCQKGPPWACKRQGS